MKKKAFLCLDPGHNGIKAIVASPQGAVYESFTMKGNPSTPNILEQANNCGTQIENRIIDIEQRHNVRVGNCYILTPHRYTHTLRKRFDMNIANGYSPVHISDIHRIELHQMPYQGNYDWEYHLISCTPTEYYIDETTAKTMPARITAKRIGCTMLMVFVTKSFYRDFEQIGTAWGIPLAGMIPQETGALIHLKHTQGQLPQSFTIVDIGKKKSAITWFADGIVQDSLELFTAGADIDASIASAFSLSLPLAEEIKLSYGNLQVSDEIQAKSIHIKTESGYQKINSLAFVQTLRSAYRALLTSITANIPGHPFRTHIFFTGGGILIEGFDTFIKELFPPVLNIEPILIKNIFSTLEGSVYYLTSKKQPSNKFHAPLFRFKELLKEYFSS